MPTIQNSFLPLPRNWQEFETIVQDALKLRYNCTHFSKNGRGGQKQNGVDIFANINGVKTGAQCKLTFNFISQSIIDTEIENAKKFTPELNHLDICTTSPRDAGIQNYIWNLNHDFTVNILFWDDITNEFEKDTKVFGMHFRYLAAEPTVEEKFNNDFRDLISYIIDKDPGSEPILIGKIYELENKLNEWIMPDLYSSDNTFNSIQKKILSDLYTWISYMNPLYMHSVWNGEAILFNNYPAENLEELKKNTLGVRQSIHNEYEKLCAISMF